MVTNLKMRYSIILLITLLTVTSIFGAWEAFEAPANPTLVVQSGSAFATLNSESHWVLKWSPQVDILPGALIELRSKGLRTFCTWKYGDINFDKADVVFKPPYDFSNDYLFTHRDYVIARAKTQRGIKHGETLTITLSVIPPYHSDQDEALSIWIDNNPRDDEDVFEKVENAVAVMHVGPGPAERLAIYSHPTPDKSGKVRTVITAEDRYGNATSFSKPVQATLEFNGQSQDITLSESQILYLDKPKDIGRVVIEIPLKAIGPGDNISNGKPDGENMIVTGNPVWAKAPHGQKAGFGEFHWHTEVSGDGTGTVDKALKVARDHVNMNYIAPGDHTPAHNRWDHLVSHMEKYYEPGAFATLFGWEDSSTHGHDNYYFTDPNHPMKPLGEIKKLHRQTPVESAKELNALFDSLPAGKKFIAVPHHTNAVAETRKPDGTPYWFAYPFYNPHPCYRLIEIFQIRGNMERNIYDNDAWRAWYGWGSSAQDALANGYKVGFTGGTDCHNGKPGFAFGALESYGRVPTHSKMLTGIWTKAITREDVFNALYDRHTWAVWDTRAIVYYTVNGALSGDEITVKKGKPLKARVKMSCEGPLQSLEVICDGKTVWINSIADLDFDIDIDLGKAQTDTCFYLRGLLRNGGIVYASPVFVNVK